MLTHTLSIAYAEFQSQPGSDSVPLDDRVCFVPVKMCIPVSAIGRLIGRGSSNLKRIMAETDVYISISRDDERGGMAYDHVITVIGSVNKQAKAVAQLYAQLKLIYETMPPQAAQPPAAPLGRSFSDPLMTGEHPLGVSPGQQFDSSLIMVPRVPAPPPIYYQPPMPMPLSNAVAAAAFHGRFPPRMMYSKHVDSIKLHIPNAVVGAVIGRKGITIKDIARQSRATIRVARSDETPAAAPGESDEFAAGLASHNGDQDRHVTITGPVDAQLKAQGLMFARIQEVAPVMDFSFRVDLFVPGDAVGRLIGKKGATVKLIIDASGAQMTINRDEQAAPTGSAPIPIKADGAPAVPQASADAPPEGHVGVSVSGSMDAVMSAQHMIREIVFAQRQQ